MQPGPEFEALEKEARLVRSMSRRILFDASLAEDVVQQTWVAMLEKPPRDPRRVGAWFSRVAKNCALKLLRGRQRSDRREKGSDPGRPQAPPDEILDRETTIRAVTDALLELPEPYKRTLIQRYYDDLPPRVIAKREGVSVEAIRSRLQRGAAMMRSRLERDHGNGGPRVGHALYLLAYPPGLEFLTDLTQAGLERSLARVARLRPALVAGAAVVGGVGVITAVASHFGSGVEIAATVDHAEPKERGTPVVRERAPTTPRSSNSRLDHEPTSFEPSSVRVVVVKERDGAPAAGVGIELISFADPRAPLLPQGARTDELGIAVIPEATSGTAEVRVDRGGVRRVDIAEHGETLLELFLPLGVNARGRVLDGFGAPVPGAAILLDTDSRDDVTRFVEVARSDASGAYVVDEIPPGRALAATHPSFGPSLVFPVAGFPGADSNLDLILTREPSRLVGRVVDEAGRPVAARLRIEPLDHDSSVVASWPTIDVAVGDDGGFDVKGLFTGPARLRARCLSSTTLDMKIELPTGGTVDRLLTLPAGATITGRVARRDGAVVPRARASIRTDDVLAGGFAAADSLGVYRLIGVPVGDVTLDFESERGSTATSRVTTEAGTSVTHDVFLDSGVAVRGKVVGIGDTPAAGVRVVVSSAVAQIERRLETNVAGEFDAGLLPTGELRLDVETSEGIALASRRTTAPLAEPIVVSLAYDFVDRQALRGTVRGAAAARVWIEIRSKEGRSTPRLIPAETDGAFESALLPRGAYSLRAIASDGRRGPQRDVDTLRAPGRSVDLALPATSSVEFQPPADRSDSLLMSVFDESGNLIAVHHPFTETWRIELPAGDYHAFCRSAGSASKDVRFSVVENQPNRVDFTMASRGD